MKMRSHVMKAAALMAMLSPVAAKATLSTVKVAADYDVAPTGVLNNISNLNAAKFSLVGGSSVPSATSPAYTTPSFTVEQFNGAAILAALDAANGTPTAPITTLNSVTLNLYDGEPPAAAPAQYHVTVGGTVDFYFASASGLTSGSSSPVFNTAVGGGLTTQLGSLDSLGTGSFTPATTGYNTQLPYLLAGTAGYNDLISAINSGSNFYIAVAADNSNPTLFATFGGQYGDAYGPGANNGLASTPSLTVNAAVPEPASLGILATSGLFLLGRRRRPASV